jgi:uroporphyrinogen decarboxylase
MPLTLDVGASAGIGPSYRDVFRSHAGAADPAEYFDYDIRVVNAAVAPSASDFSRYHGSVPPETSFDAFGVGHVVSDAFPLGMELNPWKGFTSTREIADYPFPVFELTDAARRQIALLHERGYAASAACGSINEWCYALRGMEGFLVDLVDDAGMAEAALDRVEALCTAMGTALGRAGADVLCFYGDMGSQASLIMGLSAWEKRIKPRWSRIVRAVRAATPEAVLFYHSCGFIEPLVPGLIDIGFDVLNPVQPESMDPVQIKKRYGSRISLWGGIGMQSTMLREDADGVRRAVRSLVSEWSAGGGAIVTLAQTVLPDVPWENVAALIQTLRE